MAANEGPEAHDALLLEEKAAGVNCDAPAANLPGAEAVNIAEANARLSEALSAEEVELLEKAIDGAERFGVSHVSVEPARSKLARLNAQHDYARALAASFAKLRARKLRSYWHVFTENAAKTATKAEQPKKKGKTKGSPAATSSKQKSGSKTGDDDYDEQALEEASKLAKLEFQQFEASAEAARAKLADGLVSRGVVCTRGHQLVAAPVLATGLPSCCRCNATEPFGSAFAYCSACPGMSLCNACVFTYTKGRSEQPTRIALDKG